MHETPTTLPKIDASEAETLEMQVDAQETAETQVMPVSLEGLIPKVDPAQEIRRREFMQNTYEGQKIAGHKAHLKNIIDDISFRLLRGTGENETVVASDPNKTLQELYGKYLEGNGLKGLIDFEELDVNKSTAYAHMAIERIAKQIENLGNLTDRLMVRPDLHRGALIKVSSRTGDRPVNELWMIDYAEPITARGALQITADNPDDIAGDPLYKSLSIRQAELDNPKRD